jgi:hypothetical protein
MRELGIAFCIVLASACGDDGGNNNGDPDATVNASFDAASNMADAEVLDAEVLDATPLPPDACVNSDNDSHCDVADNCPMVDNEGQEDTHGVKTRSIPFAIEALTGTPLGQQCYIENIVLPFSVTFFGQTYTEIDVLEAGLVTFTSFLNGSWGNGVPFVCTNNNDDTITPTIAVSWGNDIRPNACKGSGEIRSDVRGTAPNRRFVVSWDAVTQSPGTLTAQMIIYEADSRIEIHTQSQPMATATRGVQHVLPTPTDGRRSHLPGQNGAMFAITNESIEITTDDAPDGVGDACDNTTDETAANDCGFGY